MGQYYGQNTNIIPSNTTLAYNNTVAGVYFIAEKGPVTVYEIVALVTAAVTGALFIVTVYDPAGNTLGTITVPNSSAIGSIVRVPVTVTAVEPATPTGLYTAVVTTNTGTTAGAAQLAIVYEP